MNQALGQDAFFADTKEKAQQIMELKSGCLVRHCVFPSMCPTSYFISEHGELYGCRYHNQFQKFVGYSILPVKKRTYLTYSMQVRKGAHARPVNAERLIYCTFVLGEWNEDVEIFFKDGDRFNMTLENLGEKQDPLTPEVAERMYDWTTLYQKYFEYVAQLIAFNYNLDHDDARDLTQEAFIDLMIRYGWSKDHDFVGLWVFRAREFCVDYHRRADRHISFFKDGFDHDVMAVVHDKVYEVDLFSPLVGDTRKIVELKMQNVSEVEIAEELGIDVGSIGNMYYQAKKKLRKYWSKDPELMKIYGNHDRNSFI